MLKLIVVDDELEIKILFQTLLRKEIEAKSIELFYFESGKECIRFFNEHSNEINESYVVLSDINMPEMNGLELLGHLKQRHPYLYVTMVTAYDDDSLKAEAAKLGAISYLVKPLSFKKLKEDLLPLIVKSNAA